MNLAVGFATALITIAIATESLTELIKAMVPFELQSKHKQLIALVLAMGMAFAFNVTVFAGTGAWVMAGTLMAGLIASRGSNFTHEFIKIMERLGEALQPSDKE